MYQESYDAIIKCLLEDKRFDKGRPVAACIVYKALIQWRSFEADKTNLFDRIIHAIQSSIVVMKSIILVERERERKRQRECKCYLYK